MMNHQIYSYQKFVNLREKGRLRQRGDIDKLLVSHTILDICLKVYSFLFSYERTLFWRVTTHALNRAGRRRAILMIDYFILYHVDRAAPPARFSVWVMTYKLYILLHLHSALDLLFMKITSRLKLELCIIWWESQNYMAIFYKIVKLAPF